MSHGVHMKIIRIIDTAPNAYIMQICESTKIVL